MSILYFLLAFSCEYPHNWPMLTKDAIEFFGSRDKLAVALGIDRTATYHWGEHVPEQRQYQIQVITKNKLKARQKKAA